MIENIKSFSTLNVKPLDKARLAQMQDLSNEDLQRDIQLKDKAKELEALFLTQLLKVMEGTIPGEGLGGSENNLASMMFSSVMADSLADQGGMGLSEMLYTSLREKDAELPLPGNQSDMYLDNLNSIYQSMMSKVK
ncbi:MAG: hypothetical protein KAI81_06695 [Candidatus Marinimicrobia bacterium]|nr:hypothetical protein [Candidatus Neomarinimicrobiota bacterium]